MSTDLSSIELFMLDMDGTIYLGNRLFDATKPFLEKLRQKNKRYIFLTNNSSKDGTAYVEKLSAMGIETTINDFFTSGDATILWLKERMPLANLAVMGSKSLVQNFIENGFIQDLETPRAVVVGFDLDLNYQKLTILCNLVRKGIPYIATHPDLNCPVENGFIPDVGALIAYVKTATGREPDHIIGKPNSTIVDAFTLKYKISKDKIAIVGDRLYTDIALGENSGITSILVFSGETTPEDYKNSSIRADYVFPSIEELGNNL